MSVTAETVEMVERLLPGRRVKSVSSLRSSERTTVQRVQLESVVSGVDRVVVKQFTHRGGYAAEAAALYCLPPGLGIAVPDRLEEELDAIIRSLRVDGQALSPGDTCPDNNVRAEGGLVLVDFEEAAFRHVAWDIAYLRVPWPSCWCAWAIPPTVATETLSRYFRAIGDQTVWDNAAAFERDVGLAALG